MGVIERVESYLSARIDAINTAISGFLTGISSPDGSITIGGSSTAPTIQVQAVGTPVTAIGSATQTVTITTNTKGQVTSATVNGIAIPHGAITDWATAVSGFALLSGAAFTGTVTLQGSPTVALGAATKQYVDSVAAGIEPKPAVQALASSNVASLSGIPTFDGITPTSGQTVLLIAQTTASQNGIWVVSAGAWTRPSYFASGSNQNGAFVYVNQGTTYVGAGYTMTGPDIIVDTNPQTWTQFSDASTINAGAGLTKTGNIISANVPNPLVRNVIGTSTSITAGSATATDYVYFVTGTTTITMPTAAGNTNRYSIQNSGTNTVTITSFSGQNIIGSTSITLVPNQSVDLVSNGTTSWGIF